MKSGLPQFLTFSSAGAGSAQRNSRRHRARFSCGQSPSVEVLPVGLPAVEVTAIVLLVA